MLYDTLISPFADFGFMRRALVASLALSIGGSSIGVFLILRRMSLMGDALSHALLPGAALGFLLGGLSLPAMSLGGFLAGMATALVSGVIARFSSMREDASFAAAMGIRGSLYHYLFLALAVLNLVAGFQALGTLMALGLILLPAVAASFWAREVWSMTLIAAPMAFASAAIGLLVSFHAGLPSGPVIVLFASLFFLGSLLA